MGIALYDLVVDCTIRDGLDAIKADLSIVDDIFSDMVQGFANQKYGQTEINRIKTFLTNNHIAVVHSFHEAEAKTPCYSIQLGSEVEAKDRARLSDFEGDVQVAITDPAALAALVKVSNLTPTAYDPVSGKVSVSDSVDLSPVFPGYIYVDGSGVEFEVQTGLSNDTGDKFFFVSTDLTPNIAQPGLIKTFLNYTQHEQKGETANINILIGVHSKEALLTKYMYAILKYIMLWRKHDLIVRGILVSSYSGSDFSRDFKYEGDMVFTRFFTLTGQVDDEWASDDVPLIDSIEIDATPVSD